MRERKARIVQAVDRSLAILEAMAREGAPMALGEISAEVELTRSTVHRLLATLMARGFVRQDPISGRYFLGLKALEVGASCLTTLDIRSVARPFLRHLARECGETANLAVLDGLDVVYIDQVEAESMIKMRARLGSRGPAHCTGAGKVLLAALPEEELQRLLAGRILKRYTARTITAPERLREELRQIRKEGYAVDFGEMEPAIRCAAAPVRNYEGQVICAVSISGPSTRIDGERLRSVLVPAVRRAAQEISRELGSNPSRGLRPFPVGSVRMRLY
ncbi:MAG: IclR family transcriptional regulator [Bacillota bacterium]